MEGEGFEGAGEMAGELEAEVADAVSAEGAEHAFALGLGEEVPSVEVGAPVKLDFQWQFLGFWSFRREFLGVRSIGGQLLGFRGFRRKFLGIRSIGGQSLGVRGFGVWGEGTE